MEPEMPVEHLDFQWLSRNRDLAPRWRFWEFSAVDISEAIDLVRRPKSDWSEM